MGLWSVCRIPVDEKVQRLLCSQNLRAGVRGVRPGGCRPGLLDREAVWLGAVSLPSVALPSSSVQWACSQPPSRCRMSVQMDAVLRTVRGTQAFFLVIAEKWEEVSDLFGTKNPFLWVSEFRLQGRRKLLNSMFPFIGTFLPLSVGQLHQVDSEC